MTTDGGYRQRGGLGTVERVNRLLTLVEAYLFRIVSTKHNVAPGTYQLRKVHGLGLLLVHAGHLGIDPGGEVVRSEGEGVAVHGSGGRFAEGTIAVLCAGAVVRECSCNK